MPIENPWPLNISNKVDSPTLLAWFAQFGDETYLSAEEINKITIALDYLKEITESGGSNLFLGSYTSLENLEAAHPSPEPGSRATIFVADGDDDLALWDNGDSNWFVIEGAGAIVQDNQAKVIEFDLLTIFGTSDFSALTAGAIADKLNTLAADISPIQFPFIKISKDVTGLYQIYVLEEIGAGNTTAVVADNVKLLVDQSMSSASGGAETFSILWSPDGVYGEQNMNFNTVDQFKFSPAHSFQNSFSSVNSSTTAVDPVAPGFVIPYDCVLFKAIIRFGYSDSSPGRRDVQVFAQVGDSSSAPTFMNENLNKVILINTRINEGVTGFFSQDTTVNDVPIIDVNYVIQANSVFKHMVAGKYNLGTLRFQLQYFFKKV